MLWSNRKEILKFFVLISAILFVPLGYANEGGGEAKEGEGGEKGKEKAAKMSAAQKEYIDYQKKMSRLNTLKSRIEEADKSFEEIVKQKNHTHDKTEQQHMAEELVAISNDRKKFAVEYTALRQQILYTFPNKGEEIKKTFEPNEHRGAEEAAASTDLDDQLTEVRGAVDKKYAPFMPKEDIEAKALEEKPKIEKPKKLKLIK